MEFLSPVLGMIVDTPTPRCDIHVKVTVLNFHIKVKIFAFKVMFAYYQDPLMKFICVWNEDIVLKVYSELPHHFN